MRSPRAADLVTAFVAVVASAALVEAAQRSVRDVVLVLVALLVVGAALASAERACVLSLIVSMFLTQPFTFGAGRTTVGAGVALFAALLAISADIRERQSSASRAVKSQLLWVLVLLIWVCIASAIHPGLSSGQAIRTLLANSVVLGAGFLVFRDQRRWTWFCKTLVGIMLAICTSYVITLVVWAVSGVGSHQVATVQSRGYGAVPVYFPFTPAGGSETIHGIVLPRLIGLMREPGIQQAYFVWSFFMLEHLGWAKRRNKLLLAVGALATLSTAGFGILITVWMFRDIAVRSPNSRTPMVRQFLGVILLAGSAYVAVAAPTFGILAKDQINAASVTDRSSNTIHGVRSIATTPLGGAAPADEDPGDVAINLLAATTLYGAPYLAFGLIAYLRPALLQSRRADALILVLPLFLTSLVAQPVADAPAFWLVVLASVRLPKRPEASGGLDTTDATEAVRRYPVSV